MVFNRAQEAFEFYYDLISRTGINFDNTKALFNIGFNILNPLENNIKTKWRNFSNKYAKREWDWYLSGNPNAEEISRYAPTWKNMMDEKGNVRSNYGWQWKRNDQLNKTIDILKRNKNTRQAAISIYDGKEIQTYSKDTPCTYAINFTIINNKLNMSVLMRSNDLWYGFCNDQYCFSKLQELICKELKVNIGSYYHFVNNLHIYNNFLNKNNETKQ
jgi:thymidylate synthase